MAKDAIVQCRRTWGTCDEATRNGLTYSHVCEVWIYPGQKHVHICEICRTWN